MPRVKLSVRKHHGGAGSTVASFPSGPLTKRMLSTVEWRVTKGKRDGTFGISGEKGKIKWHGSKSMVPEHQPSGDFNYVVAVYNKRSRKLSCSTRSATALRLCRNAWTSATQE